MSANGETTRLTFYFDPLCPWAWLTSLWIREVRRQRPVEVDWKFFSLAGINENEDKWHGPLRIAALARREGGNDAVDRAYLALGRLFHEQRDSFDQIDDLATVAQPYLRDVGLDPSLAPRALDDPSTVDDVVVEQKDATERLGAFGVPWLVLGGDDFGFFGPVINEALRGQEAVDLWDHFQFMGSRPYLYELKRGRKSMQDLSGLSAAYSEPVPVGE
ncbi:MAG TPA: DsbA family protein [Chloroflexota bacterium]